MKKILFALFAAALLLCSCKADAEPPKSSNGKTVHCDNCEKEFEIEASSNMDDSWIIYCAECEKALGLDDLIK